jgi:hypothetical protein
MPPQEFLGRGGLPRKKTPQEKEKEGLLKKEVRTLSSKRKQLPTTAAARP